MAWIFRRSFSTKWAGFDGQFQLINSIFKKGRDRNPNSAPARCNKMNQEKDPTDAKEQNEERQFENEQQSPL